jgi:phenylacetate-CoA ligase
VKRSFVRNILFPLHEWAKKHSTLPMFKELERTQWLDRGALRELQEEKLRTMFRSAREHVPYYRELPEVAGLVTLPLLNKAKIREHREHMRSDMAKGLVRSNTGGSTGEPLIFYIGKRRISADVAAKLRATNWWGVDIGDPEVVIWGAPVELNKQDRVREFRDRLFRTKLLSAFDMTEETMSAYLDFIRRLKPRHVFGYPSSIYLLCNYAKKKSIRLHDLGVKVVFCTAERLYDHQRELISEIFAAPVANGYGGRDAGFIAHECPQGRMHITNENMIVEVVDDMGKPAKVGEAGEVIVTHLESHDFPFIRYKTGDVGVLSDEQCPCGRGLTVLGSVEGRSTDFVVTPERKVLHGLSLIYKVRDTEGVEAFKIIQEDYDLVRLFLSVNGNFTPAHEAAIREDWGKRLGGNVRIEVEYRDKIAHEKSGKFRYVESKVRA